jgi:hypothetical protein
MKDHQADSACDCAECKLKPAVIDRAMARFQHAVIGMCDDGIAPPTALLLCVEFAAAFLINSKRDDVPQEVVLRDILNRTKSGFESLGPALKAQIEANSAPKSAAVH